MSDSGQVRPNKKRKYKQALKPKVENAFTLPPGIKGVLATVVKDKEKFAIRELFNLFNEYADELYGPEIIVNEKSENIEDAIAQEVEGLNQTKRRFTSMFPGMPCIVFIRMQDPIDPVELTHYILKDLEAKQIHKTKHINRLHPLSVMCGAYEEDIRTVAKQLIDTHLKPNQSWAVIPRSRFNTSINRDLLIEAIGQQVDQTINKVDLENPEVCFVVEVFKTICGISVVKDYHRFKRYNLHELVKTNA